LSADDVYALTTYILHRNDLVPTEFLADRDSLPTLRRARRTARCHATKVEATETPVTDHPRTRPAWLSAFALALWIGASAGPALAQSSVDEGRKLAFDRGKGNCLTCHVIKGGDLPGTIGPELADIKSKYPNRDELVAIISDETTRNPLTVMPPFGRNRILTEKEISAVVDFLQTL
jgi:sulfur-oxidizing protein SoxX